VGESEVVLVLGASSTHSRRRSRGGGHQDLPSCGCLLV